MSQHSNTLHKAGGASGKVRSQHRVGPKQHTCCASATSLTMTGPGIFGGPFLEGCALGRARAREPSTNPHSLPCALIWAAEGPSAPPEAQTAPLTHLHERLSGEAQHAGTAVRGARIAVPVIKEGVPAAPERPAVWAGGEEAFELDHCSERLGRGLVASYPNRGAFRREPLHARWWFSEYRGRQCCSFPGASWAFVGLAMGVDQQP